MSQSGFIWSHSIVKASLCTAGLFHLCDSIYQASNQVLTDCKAKLAFKTVLMPCEKAQNCGEGNGFFLSKIYNLTNVLSRQPIAIATIISRLRSLKSLENFEFIYLNTNVLFLHWNNLIKLKNEFFDILYQKIKY